MIVGDLRNKVDSIWNTIWTGGITNPITAVEQITYLMFIKLIDDIEKIQTLSQQIKNASNEAILSIVAGDEGFEPPHVGTRTRCLTAWLIPKVQI